MKQKWLEWVARFDVLARRERVMVAVAVLVGGSFLGYSLLIEPQLIRETTQAKRIAQATLDLATVKAQLAATQAQLKDPDAANRAALLQGRNDLAALDAKLRTIENSMVPPDKMQGFLESLLSRNRNLELLALRTLPPTTLIERIEEKKADAKADASPGPPPSAAPNIYKHGIEIRIAGSYNDLLMYLAEIERMPQRVIWNRVRLSTEQYPRSEMTLTVFTLSLDKQWLVV
ncbi:MAG: type II secretion system protein GspM [Sterolibacterium sp.]|nr:type II secretion system protein GspM [Sterolibacterium sp.]